MKARKKCDDPYLDICLFVEQRLSCCNGKQAEKKKVRGGGEQKPRSKATIAATSEILDFTFIGLRGNKTI